LGRCVTAIYKEVQLGIVSRPEEAANLFPQPKPLVTHFGGPFVNNWAGD
jgi:hypothetical protein